MLNALWSSATGMYAQQLNLDVVSNNIANVNTTGFKKNRIDFQDLLYQNLKTAGTPNAVGLQNPVGIQVGLGAKVVSTAKVFTQGAIEQTGNVLDIAIEGDGFFQVLYPTGETVYTRDGSFKINRDGQIVTADGLYLQPEITIPSEATQINIGMDGTVSVILAGETTPTEIGRIELVKFVNPAGLISIGKNLYKQSDASGDPIVGFPGESGLGTLAQGFLERSNVDVVEEMVNLIIIQRAYEVNSKSIQTADEILRIATTLRR
jgi:flagellar basal-body rod protein FlgG